MRHGWAVESEAASPEHAEFVRAAAGAVPASVAGRIGMCRVSISEQLASPELTSEWSETADGIEISLAAAGAEPHDVALEFLYCLGQALWEGANDDEVSAWFRLLRTEVDAGITGEIDEDSLAEKERLSAGGDLAEQLETWAAAAFASTLAEYIHSIWHDVHVRTGPEHLPPDALRTRLEFFAGIMPPDPDQQLWASSPTT